MTVGKRLKNLREELGMSLEDVAGKIGIGRATVYKYENGMITNIPPEKIEQLADLYSVSPSYIMGWTAERHSSPAEDLDTVAAQSRIPPPGIVVPDTALFARAIEVLSPEDMATLTRIFNRAFEAIKAKEREA